MINTKFLEYGIYLYYVLLKFNCCWLWRNMKIVRKDKNSLKRLINPVVNISFRLKTIAEYKLLFLQIQNFIFIKFNIKEPKDKGHSNLIYHQHSLRFKYLYFSTYKFYRIILIVTWPKDVSMTLKNTSKVWNPAFQLVRCV